MSTPLKALIQERLRAKMVRRGPGYDLDDDYECDSDRLLRQSMDVTAYDITSRGDDEETLMSAGSRGSSSRRSSSTQPSYPIRLQTHIDPSAYLVPAQNNERYYPPSSSYGSNSSSHDDQSRQRYSREQYRELSVYDPPPRPEQPIHHRRRQHSHQRMQQPPRYEPPTRGSYISRQPSQTRASVSPWHRSEYTSAPRKSNSMTRSPMRAVSSPGRLPSPRGHRKQDFEYPDHFDNEDYTHHRRDTKRPLPSARFTVSSSSSHQTQHQGIYQRQRYTWKDDDLDYSNQAAYEVREPSPTRHRDHYDYPTFSKPVRHSPEHHNHPNQTESDSSISSPAATAPSPHKPQPEEIDLVDVTQNDQQPERQSPPALDMEIIEPPTKSTGRIRAWDDIMSPESRLAAKAFVEKRQRRAEKSTPRTMATQRWLEVIDARASRHEAAAT